MSRKVLILSGSPRKGGNSDILCGEFARGARENGSEVEIIRVAAKKIAPVPAAISAGPTAANAPIKTTWRKCCRR